MCMVSSNDLSVGCVSRNLGVSPTTIRRYIRDGKMKAYRIGGRWRVPETAMEAFLISCNEGREKMASIDK